jgi:hypothetical protein
MMARRSTENPPGSVRMDDQAVRQADVAGAALVAVERAHRKVMAVPGRQRYERDQEQRDYDTSIHSPARGAMRDDNRSIRTWAFSVSAWLKHGTGMAPWRRHSGSCSLNDPVAKNRRPITSY